MPTSMAGATSRGQRAARAVMVSRLSAMPWANLPSVLAVHGAITSKSALWPSPTCSTCACPPHRSASVKALRPVTDWKVSGVMNFSAAGVRMHIHLGSGLGQFGGQVGGFVGGDGSGDPEQDVLIGE